MEWIPKDFEWIFSGVGVVLVTGLVVWWRRKPDGSDGASGLHSSITITQNNSPQWQTSQTQSSETAVPPQKPKASVCILFVDDDVKFKVVSILKAHGWTHTKMIRDVTSLEQPDVASADIFFIDIQGVGKALQFKDEGLGLVVALKKKYPEKKVVIYSAESGLNAFHLAFKIADDRISKDADPYEFIEVVERLSA